eukprot:2267834-Amphidinium_carterae.1
MGWHTLTKLDVKHQWGTNATSASWPELIQSLADDEKIRKCWGEAMDIKYGKKVKTWSEKVVTKNNKVVLEVCKEELKKQLGVDKLSKDDLKGIPKIELQIADGLAETVFYVKNPQCPLRTCKVRHVIEDAIGETVMGASYQL